MSSELLSVYFHILAQTLGWGTVNKPPESGQRVWLADTFMYQKWEDTGIFRTCMNVESGVSGDFANLEKFRNNSESCAELRCQSLRSQLAIISINLHASHWVYAVVDFEIKSILLNNSHGDSNSVIMERVSKWAAHILTCRQLSQVEFTRRVVTTKTQFDGHQCGVHIGGNILSIGSGCAHCVNGSIVQPLRLWMSIIILDGRQFEN